MDIKPGDIIRHAEYGDGRVVAVINGITVAFPKDNGPSDVRKIAIDEIVHWWPQR